MDASTALTILQRLHLDGSADFHTLTSSDVERLLDEARAYKYRKPRNANGSRARYFYAFLLRASRRNS